MAIVFKEGTKTGETIACLKTAKGYPSDSPKRVAPKGIVWDEETIAEHDMDRGTRQKIEEPDTPFIHSPQAASEPTSGTHSVTKEEQIQKAMEAQKIPQAQQAEQLQNDLNAKLTSWFARDGHRVSIQEQWDDVPDTLRPATQEGSENGDSRQGSKDLAEEEAEKRAFEMKRKQHYNEAAAVKALLAKKMEEEDEDEDDEDEDEEEAR